MSSFFIVSLFPWIDEDLKAHYFLFRQNNFVANTFDFATNGRLQLNTLSNNYWDKYEGYDLNKDAIGDVPYRPISLYSMVVEKNPTAMLLFRSFMVMLLDRTERMIPTLTPEDLKDDKPALKPFPLWLL